MARALAPLVALALAACLGPPARYGTGGGGAGGDGGVGGAAGGTGGAAGAAGSGGQPSLTWVKVLGDEGAQDVGAIAAHADFHVHLVGTWEGLDAADVAPAPLFGDCGGNAVFVAELDAFGEWVWARCLGQGTPEAFSIAVGAAGEVAVAYAAAQSLEGPGGPQPTTGTDGAFALLDGDGALLWVRPVTGPQRQRAMSVSFGEDGALYAAGTFRSVADFGAEQHDAGLGEDVFYGELDVATGDFAWLHVAASADQGTYAVRISAPRVSGAPLGIAGVFSTALAFPDGTTLTSSGSVDVFFGALDTAGTPLWLRAAGGPTDDALETLAMGKTELLVGGSFSETLDVSGDGSLVASTNPNDTDAWLAKLDALTGEVTALRVVGGAGNQSSTVGQITPWGVVAGGAFGDELDLGEVVTALSSPDAWLGGFDASEKLPLKFRLALQGPGAQPLRGLDFRGAEAFYAAGRFGESLLVEGAEHATHGGFDIYVLGFAPP